MNDIKRPEIKEIYGLLKEKDALIVHFSGAPKGDGPERPDNLYPKDLFNAIKVQEDCGLSCSTVMPKDKFYGFERNAIGCIGIIVGLRSPSSLYDVCHEDCGSYEDKDCLRKSSFKEMISISDLRDSIECRNYDSYNEWVVNRYSVLGILAVKPFEISVMNLPDIPRDMPLHLTDNTPVKDVVQTNLLEISDKFSGFPIYTFKGGKIYQFTNNEYREVNHSQIYKN